MSWPSSRIPEPTAFSTRQPRLRSAPPSIPNGGGQGPNETQLLATVIVKGGTSIPLGALGRYVNSTLVRNNPNLLQNTRRGLAQGDLTPWRGMPEEGPASNSTNPNKIAFYIGNLPEPPTKQTNPIRSRSWTSPTRARASSTTTADAWLSRTNSDCNQYCGMWHTFKDTVFVQNDYLVKIRTTYVR